MATPQVGSGKLQNIINDLYKGTTKPWVPAVRLYRRWFMSGCFSETVFVPGRDSNAAARNDAAAIADGLPWRVHYVSQQSQTLTDGWYGKNCGGQDPRRSPELQCDEYPFYTTSEAGPGARLAWVNGSENSNEGGSENSNEGRGISAMQGTCKFQSGKPGETPPVTGSPYLVIPLPDVVPLTTYICGDRTPAP